MTTLRNAKPRVSQKLLALAAFAMVVALAFVPAGQTRSQADTISTADSSRSLAAR